MWTKVCDLSGVPPGSLSEHTVDGVPVLVVRGVTRTLVVPRSCPHLSAPLCEGVFDGHTLTCTKHLWQWSVDEGGEPVGEAEEGLLCYPTRDDADGTLHADVSTVLRYGHELDG